MNVKQLPLVWTERELAQPLLERELDRADWIRKAVLARLETQQITDVLQEHTEMHFAVNGNDRLILDCEGGIATIHKHALNQMATKVKYPITAVNYYLGHAGWGPKELGRVFNVIYENKCFRAQDGENHKFLLRIVDNEIRGFMSRRYALHFSTNPLLVHFMDYCREMTAQPIEFLTSYLRIALKCVLPTIFEPFPGQTLCVGMTFSNSDFGAGAFSVSNAIWDPVRGLGMTIGTQRWEEKKGELFERVHLGPMLHEQDLNRVTSACATRTEEISRKIRAEITTELGADKIQRVLDVVKYANDKELPWLLLRRQLKTLLSEGELETITNMLQKAEPTLPKLGIELDVDGFPIPTHWWAASAVSMIAKSTLDADRALDLQQVAGSFIEQK